MKLFLYSPPDLAKPVLTFQFDPVRNKSGRIWHCRIPLVQMCDARSVFIRNADGSLNWGDAPIFSEIAADPELGRLALIAEPSDVGGYQLGRGFPVS